MSTMNQTIVEPMNQSVDEGIPLSKGNRNNTDLFACFPNSPLPGYAGVYGDDQVKALFNAAVRTATPGAVGASGVILSDTDGLNGYYGVNFTRDFTGVAPGILVPDINQALADAVGIPTPWTPNTVSPGEDWSGPATAISPATQPSDPMPGAGGGNQLSPSVSSDSMAVTGTGAATLGDYALGQSPASLPAEPIETP
jgi:hypothetical protein